MTSSWNLIHGSVMTSRITYRTLLSFHTIISFINLQIKVLINCNDIDYMENFPVQTRDRVICLSVAQYKLYDHQNVFMFIIKVSWPFWSVAAYNGAFRLWSFWSLSFMPCYPQQCDNDWTFNLLQILDTYNKNTHRGWHLFDELTIGPQHVWNHKHRCAGT